MSDIQLCPSCGSGKVLAAIGLSSNIRCTACAWSGQANEAVTKPLELGQAEDIAAAVAMEYMRALAVYSGAHIGRAMVEVGLVTASDTKVLVRLIRAAVTGAHKATLEEIEKMQQEIKNG